MAFSDFTLEEACSAFTLNLSHKKDLFGEVSAAPVSPQLRDVLEENVPLALSVDTDKARSELIVAPILVEVRRLMNRQIGYFSGVEFDVVPGQGLKGTCDFILTACPLQLILRRPVLVIAAGKNDNIISGLGPCVATMVAARAFNEKAGEGPSRIFGAVTTGRIWRFLTLVEDKILIDHRERYISSTDKLLGILLHCVGGDPATAGESA
jgi:hypothetical protein